MPRRTLDAHQRIHSALAWLVDRSFRNAIALSIVNCPRIEFLAFVDDKSYDETPLTLRQIGSTLEVELDGSRGSRQKPI
eukprot:989211-Pyramimonas_sp.AAC.1